MAKVKNYVLESYNTLSGIIRTLNIIGRLTDDESTALLNLLDLIVKENDAATLKVLNEYLALDSIPENEEIDQIVRASILGCSWKDPESRRVMLEVLRGLAEEKKKTAQSLR